MCATAIKRERALRDPMRWDKTSSVMECPVPPRLARPVTLSHARLRREDRRAEQWERDCTLLNAGVGVAAVALSAAAAARTRRSEDEPSTRAWLF